MNNNDANVNITFISNQVESTLDSTRNFGIFLNKSLSIIKMCHWYTEDYNVHKILGKVYDNLSDLFDSLQEEIIGTVKQQGKPFPEIFIEIDLENIQNYRHMNDINMQSYYKASQSIIAALTSQEVTSYVLSVVSGINNTKEEIISTLNNSNYLLSMVKV
jgi:hypothetical protein